MELLNKEEHLKCFNYANSIPFQIEIIRYMKGEWVELTPNTNQIVFFLEGEVKYNLQNITEYESIKEKMIFLPTGYRCTCFIEIGRASCRERV